MKNFLLLLLLLLSIFSCDTKLKECEKWDSNPTEDIFITLNSESTVLSDSILKDFDVFVKWEGESISSPRTLYHMIKGIYLDDSLYFNTYNSYISDDSRDGLAFFRYFQLNKISFGIDTFFLRNKMTEDVYAITIETEKITDNCQAWAEECQCKTPLRKIFLNGKEMSRDNSLSEFYNFNSPIYRLELD